MTLLDKSKLKNKPPQKSLADASQNSSNIKSDVNAPAANVKAPSPNDESTTENKDSIAATTSAEENLNIIPIETFGYNAAAPHFGPLIRITDLTATYQENEALASLPIDSDVTAKQNQNVILYDKNGKILPLGGKVEKIDGDTLIISLPEATDTSLLNQKVSVITLETIGSKRLPLSALQKDDNNKSFVWVATPAPNTNGHTVEKRAITVDIKGDKYFEAGLKVRATDLVILDPDSSLEANKEYKIGLTEIKDAPLHNPIKQAWIDFEMNRLEEAKAEMAQRLEDCLNGVGQQDVGTQDIGAITNPDGSTSSSASCGGDLFKSEDDPLAIFNSILNTNMGGCSAACGQ